MYFEEFQIGQKFYLEPIMVSLEEINEFAAKYDSLPLHLDENFAQKSAFHGIIASGFHTLCIIWGQWTGLNKTGAEVIAGVGMDYLNWTAPVYPGDSLTGEVEVVDLIPSSKSGQGTLVTKTTVYNQDNKIVLMTQVKSLMKSKLT